MGSSASTLCQYFLKKSSKFEIIGLAPIAVCEREAATLRPCAKIEPKAANGSCLVSFIVSERDKASLRP